MTAVKTCATNKETAKRQLHQLLTAFLTQDFEGDLLCATFAEVSTAGSASLYSAGIDQ